MSTFQPSGGPPPEPTPYAQPQDPWAGGHEAGVAAAPTDPIPQQQQQPYGQFAPGVAAPSVWTQETMSQGGPYGYVPQQEPRSRVGIYILVMLAVVVLGGGGGYGAWYLITRNAGTGNTPQGLGSSTGTDVSTGASNSTGANATETLDPATVKVNDCIFNIGTTDKPAMIKSDCAKSKSYKVVKIQSGEAIPEGPDGKFDKDHTAPTVCAGTPYQAWFAWDSSDNKKDFFFCLTNNP